MDIWGEEGAQTDIFFGRGVGGRGEVQITNRPKPRGPTSNKFGRGEGTFGGMWMAEARICFSAVPPSRTRCVATAYSSGQSDGQITEWSVVVSAFHGMRQNSSESCCSDVSVCLCPCLFAPAGVAVFSAPLATTEQHAADHGFWAGEGSRWRVLWLRSAGKAVHECPPT